MEILPIDRKALYTQIYKSNGWGGNESRSGKGSDVSLMTPVIERLPALFREYRIQTVLDAPCGDFNWMKAVDLSEISYIGGDIVSELIENNKKYEKDNIKFRQMDIVEDSLPEVDLIICRDGLVHFSDKDIFRALSNFNCKYLLMTTFPEKKNKGPEAAWRPLNFEYPPYDLGPPLELINEGIEGRHSDKSQGLWLCQKEPK